MYCFKSSCFLSSPSALMSPIHRESYNNVEYCILTLNVSPKTSCTPSQLSNYHFFMSFLLFHYIFPNSYSLLMTLFPTSSRKLNYQKTTSSARPHFFVTLYKLDELFILFSKTNPFHFFVLDPVLIIYSATSFRRLFIIKFLLSGWLFYQYHT